MKRIVIIGGGVSGLVTAIKTKNNNNEVIIIEKNEELGKKILVTGNGRCNFLNDDFTSNHYHSVVSNDIEKLINEDSKNKILDFIKELGIEYKTKNGYYYPFTNKASTIRDALIEEVLRRNIKVITNYKVTSIKKENDVFIINNDIKADYLVIGTGSKSYPITGTTGDLYSALESLGHSVTDLYPSLVQITTSGKFLKKLSGVRCDALVGIYLEDNKIKEEYGELQLTDYGVSGICVFNLSRYVSYLNNGNMSIRINFMPYLKEDVISYFDKKDNGYTVLSLLKRVLNEKIVLVLLDLLNIDKNTLYKNLSKEEKNKLSSNLTEFKLSVTGTKSFDNSQVTAGGIDLNEIDINAFESKIVDNLYITGEILDVDGDCGGYNIAFAILSALIVSDSLRGKND